MGHNQLLAMYPTGTFSLLGNLFLFATKQALYL